jgi:hypothetical protein
MRALASIVVRVALTFAASASSAGTYLRSDLHYSACRRESMRPCIGATNELVRVQACVDLCQRVCFGAGSSDVRGPSSWPGYRLSPLVVLGRRRRPFRRRPFRRRPFRGGLPRRTEHLNAPKSSAPVRRRSSIRATKPAVTDCTPTFSCAGAPIATAISSRTFSRRPPPPRASRHRCGPGSTSC